MIPPVAKLPSASDKLDEKQHGMIKAVKDALKLGLLGSRHLKRTFTERATPFFFPEALSVN